MPKPLREGLPTGRYDYATIAAEIARVLKRKRGAQARAAEAALLQPHGLSHRLRLGGQAQLRLEHIGAIADHLRAPKGWPFIPWEEAEAMQKAIAERRKRTREP